MHRDQYKDHAGRVHPLIYFKSGEFRFQCPGDPTRYLNSNLILNRINNTIFRTYLKFPETYIKYNDPAVLPITLERSYRSPCLPARALTGRYAPISDISYKR